MVSGVGKLRHPEGAAEAAVSLGVPAGLRGSGLLRAHPWAELALAADTIVSPDFAEGVRCTMIDKQDEPQWSPATVGEVDVEAIRRVLDQPGQLRTRP